MKKILLSVIALFAAVSMNAQTKVQAEDGAFDINQPDAQKWGGTWYDFETEGTKGNFDASTYDYVWIKFSGNTGKFRFGITYNEWKSTEAWGETFFDEVKYIEDAEGIVFTKLEKEKTYEFGGPDKAASPYAGDTWDKHIQNVYTQDDGAPVNVKVEGIWFGTAAELKAVLGGGGEQGGEQGGEEPAATGDFTVVSLNVDNALGLDSENGSPLAKDLALYDGEEGTLSIGADDTYKPMDIAAIVGGEPLKGGLQGGSNPKDADGGTPATTLLEPVSGAFFKWVAKKDGFLYIIHKSNASKAYTVFEEGSALGYKFAAQGDEATPLGAVYQFEVEGEGEYNYVSTPIEWAQQEYLKEADPEFYASNWEDVEKDGVTTSTWKKIQNAEAKDIQGLGVIVFPVYAESEYVFNANGSKMMLAGFAFSANDDLTIATEDGVEIYKGGGATAIQGAKVVTVAGNSAIYNLAGQKVNASYKGIVIKDGKKYIQK